MNPAALQILLVEDSPTDQLLTCEALRQTKLHPDLHMVIDGVEALAFLRREGRHTAAPRPDLILLDLNLPRKDGREVLAELKADPELRSIPVVVLTTSRAPTDVAGAYERYANAYISKPVDFDHFGEVVRAIERFWFSIALLPSRAALP